MTNYYVRASGSDANPGTAALPWQHLSKINGLALAAGDQFLLASDSVFDIEQTVGPYPASWTGTETNPCIIGRYDPAGVAPGGRPLIRFRKSILTGAWTYDATKNGWWFQDVETAEAEFCAWIRLGGTNYGYFQDTAFPLASVDRYWKSDAAGKCYVYAPSGTNPTTYYGSVEFATGARGAFSFGNGTGSIVVQDIDVADGGGLCWVYRSSGTNRITVRRCSSTRAGYLMRLVTDTAGLLTGELYSCSASGGINMYLNAYGTQAAVECHHNMFDGSSIGWPSGQVYLQCSGGTSNVYCNHFTNCPFGTPDHPGDPGAMYAEFGSHLVNVYRNRFTDCVMAMIDNSGRTTRWYSNIAVNCREPFQLSDLESVGATNFGLFHNTFVGCGNPLASNYGYSPGGIGFYQYHNQPLDVRNNIFTRHASASSEPCFELGVSTTGTIANNGVYGFPSVAATYLGGASPVTPSGTVTGDPLLTSTYGLDPSSPCKNTGADLTAMGMVDYHGVLITDTTPDMGAFAGTAGGRRKCHPRPVADS